MLLCGLRDMFVPEIDGGTTLASSRYRSEDVSFTAMKGNASQSWRLGEWEFRPASGELVPLSSGDAREARRLQPQPAQLLELLLERGCEIVTRDEIRDHLWPGTHVDLSQSLSFCVRQIRTALGDSSTEPVYLETLPRRGYRLLQLPEPMADGSMQLPVVANTVSTPGPLWRGAWAVFAVLLIGSVFWLSIWASREPSPKVRLAIMPFELAAGDSPTSGFELAKVSESLVVELARDEHLEIVGPRTTVRYSAFPFPDLEQLESDLGIDYVLNARFLPGEVNDSEPTLIVELIRLTDRAHPWVEQFAASVSPRVVTEEVLSGVTVALDADSR